MSDEPSALLDPAFLARLGKLRLLVGRRYAGSAGGARLSTRRGSLNDEERREIENHVSDSWKFLRQIPWTADLARVPEIAGQHHEKMNGKGYPNGVPAAQTLRVIVTVSGPTGQLARQEGVRIRYAPNT